MNKKRMFYFFVFVGLFCIELYIALFVHDNFVRPYLGDVIFIPLVYCLLRTFVPKRFRFLLLGVLILAIGVEFAQLLGITKWISGGNPFLLALLGTSYSFVDIICYVAGTAITFCVEWVLLKKRNSK